MKYVMYIAPSENDPDGERRDVVIESLEPVESEPAQPPAPMEVEPMIIGDIETPEQGPPSPPPQVPLEPAPLMAPKKQRIPVLPLGEIAAPDDPLRARIIHPRINAAKQFGQALMKRPMILELCARCGNTDQHTKDDCVVDLEGCDWVCCPDPMGHNFFVCPFFVQRCGVSGCWLRGHNSTAHEDVAFGFDYCMDDYVREWERVADGHFYARARRAYSPWGCNRMLQVMDHLSLNEVYFYSVTEWNVLLNSLSICETVLEARDSVVSLEDRAALKLESNQRDRHLQNALRMEMEERVLGRPMTPQERDYFLYKYELRPIQDPQLLSHLVLYLRLKERNEQLSLYAPVLRYIQDQRREPRPFPPWFDPSKPRTSTATDTTGREFRLCVECKHVVTHELHPHGYCFVCGHERDPPEKHDPKKPVDPEPVERQLALRLRGFGQPGTEMTRAKAPADIRRNIALEGDIIDSARPALLPEMPPTTASAKKSRPSSRQRERRQRYEGRSASTSSERSRSPRRRSPERRRESRSPPRRTSGGSAHERRESRPLSRDTKRSRSPPKTRSGESYARKSSKEPRRPSRSPICTRGVAGRLGERRSSSVFERLGKKAESPSSSLTKYHRLEPKIEEARYEDDPQDTPQEQQSSIINRMARTMADRLRQRRDLPPTPTGVRIRSTMLARLPRGEEEIKKLTAKTKAAGWVPVFGTLEPSERTESPIAGEFQPFKIPKVPARREESSSKPASASPSTSKAAAASPAPSTSREPVPSTSSLPPGVKVQVVKPGQRSEPPPVDPSSKYAGLPPAGLSDEEEDDDYLELGVDPYEWTMSDLDDLMYDSEDELGRRRDYGSSRRKKKKSKGGRGKKSQ
jgi:hypothetical protein